MVYRYFIRPLLFLIDPESVHTIIVSILKGLFKIPGAGSLVRSVFSLNHPSLERKVFGIHFKNPVGLAAGFDKNAELYNELAGFGFSFIEVGTVTPKAQPGNEKPRLFRLPEDKALINRMGINNDGANAIAAKLRKNVPGVIIGGNIGKNTDTLNRNAIEDYKYCFEVLHDVVDYFVVNVSCPNIGDIKELQDGDLLEEILGTLNKLSEQKPVKKPVLLKISPDLNYDQLEEVVKIALKTRIAGFVAVNTTITRNGLRTGSSRLNQIGNGGLSGIPLKDRSTEVIRYLVSKSEGIIPVIGVGGIASADDAVEKLEAGASLVQVYTGFVYEGPAIVRNINMALLRKTKIK